MAEAQQPGYRREFLKSPHHVWLGALTLGAGFIAAQPLALIAGATAYLLGWIYLPDLAFFRHWVDRRRRKATEAESRARLEEFVRKRDTLLASLSTLRRQRYEELADVCRSIESAGTETVSVGVDGNELRVRRLDELMWTFLRLLSIEESLERFLETERREDVPALVQEAEEEVGRIEEEVKGLRGGKGSANLGVRERLLESRRDRLSVLRKRLARVDQARDNLGLVVSEQQRLDQQIKLIRAEAFAMKNATALSARIDATVEHLDQTNKWLSEMDEFKDLVGGLPQTELRVGYESAPPPVLEEAPTKTARRRRRSQSQ
ncbi:MAG: hypothetical protein H7A46_14560 [Verrucomicrobiales bacterium]|nr:hypothetical protein [Verrucomicrobiales bacterium]